MSNWGQGVINNAIEWGKGAINNAIGWGIYYLDSWAGDTEIYGYNANAQTYFTAYEAAGGSYTSDQKAAFSTWFQDGEDNGWLSAMIAVNFFQGSSIAPNLINVINPGTYNLTNVNILDANVSGGAVTTDGTTKYVHYGASPATIFTSPLDYYYYAYNKTAPTSGTARGLMGGSSAATNSQVIIYTPVSTTTTQARGGSAVYAINRAGIPSGQSVAAIRTSATAFELFVDTTSQGTNTTSAATNQLGTQNLTAFANNASGAISQYCDGSWYTIAIGEGMDATKHAAFDAATKTLIAAL